jgi:hypothetical protein
MPSLGPDQLQWPVPGSSGKPEVKLGLTGSDPLCGELLQRRNLVIAVRRAKMFDLP